MHPATLSRRRFNLGCATFGLALSGIPGILRAADEADGRKAVKFPDGRLVPPLGQGCWHLGQGRHPLASEQEALRLGLTRGMTLIDTSGNYGGGRSEQALRPVIGAARERVFLVSKVEAGQVAGDGIARACEASLARLGTPYLDLYLMHWPVPTTAFPGMVRAFEQLRTAGKIRAWGVSNFSRTQMDELFKVAGGERCATNQVPYSLNARDIERELIPWCVRRGVPVMAYSPLGGEGNLVIGNPALRQVAAAHGCAPAAAALAWVIRGGNVIAIPESGSPAHVAENAAAFSVDLTAADLAQLDAAFPGPAIRGTPASG